jgi:hypothetical protein
MTQLWTPSDELLGHDPIALQKIQLPFEPIDLTAHGISFSDEVDDDANEAAACVVLASLDEDDSAGDETGETDDDEEIEDPDDDQDVSGDV